MEASSADDASWREGWDIDRTVAYLQNNGFTRVTLQFPDDLLEQSTIVCAAIQQQCAVKGILAQVSVLADTTYNPLNVDEVAAQHANADCVVHYGRASMSPLSCLPAYFVFGQQPLDVPATAERIAGYASAHGSEHKTALVFMDQLLLHAASQLQAHVQQIQQACQHTMEVLYAEVKSRTMEPAHVDTSGVKPQTDCKQQGISSCCQSTPEAQSASAAPTAAVPAVPAVPAEPADPAGDAVSPHTQGQAIAIAAEMDARKAPQDKASPCTSSATDKLQDPDSTSGTSNNTAVSTEQPQGASKAGITDRPADSSLRAASLANATAQQVDMTDGAAAHSIESDGAQQADIADGAAASSIESDGAQQADIAVGVAAHSVASDGGGCRHGQIAGYTWTLPAGVQQEDCVMIWVGPEDAAALTHLQLTFNKFVWANYDPEQDKWQEGLPVQISRTLKRRYFLVEKAKNANVVGILVGTLGVAGYRDAIDSIRSLAKKAGKKTYTMLMGKPNPAKLANLPEVEVFVMVADPQGMILDSKEYYAPIITPFEAYLAFSGEAEWDGSYSLDFTSLQNMARCGGNDSAPKQPRFSLLDGSYHANGTDGDSHEEEGGNGEASTALAKRAEQALQLSGGQSEVTTASEYLQKRRTFKGLEAPVVGAEKKPVIKAVQGQTGRAAQYTHEAAS